jgi:hypothetical protein
MRTFLIALSVLFLAASVVAEDAPQPKYYAQFIVHAQAPTRILSKVMEALRVEQLGPVAVSGEPSGGTPDAKTGLVHVSLGCAANEAQTLDKIHAAHKALFDILAQFGDLQHVGVTLLITTEKPGNRR